MEKYSIIQDILDTIKFYENICTRILRKTKMTPKDEFDYQNAQNILIKCDEDLDALGYFDGSY